MNQTKVEGEVRRQDADYPGSGPFVSYPREKLNAVIIQKSAGFDLKRRVKLRKLRHFHDYCAPRAWEICRDGIFYGWVDEREGGWFWTLPNGATGWHGPYATRRAAVIGRSKL